MNKILRSTIICALALSASLGFAETDAKALKEIRDIRKGVDNRNQIETLRVSDNATIGGNLTVSGTTTQTGAASFTGAVSAEQLTSTDDALITDDLTVGGDVVVTGELTVATSATVAGALRSTSAGTAAVTYATPFMIQFNPTTAGGVTTNSYTVPAGYDLVITDAYGWKTDAAAAAGDTWDLQNNDGSAANIFTQLDIGTSTLADGAKGSFTGLDDAEDEIEAGDTLEFIATETADDDGAEGIIIVEGYLKIAD